MSFETAWKQWGDSLIRAAQRSRPPIAGWRELTSEGWIVSAPRWMSESSLLYGAATGREVSQAYMLGLDGSERSIGRRNAPSINVPLPNGDVLFSQPDLIDAYRLRNDLYVQRGDDEIRLTRGARLSTPDVRRDGAIVAVQQVPGSTRLVRVSADGKSIVPITAGGLDLQWADPRWSPEGGRIAAIRIPRGNGRRSSSSTPRHVRFSHQFQNAVAASPSWSRDGTSCTSHRIIQELCSCTPWTSECRRIAHSARDAVTGVFTPSSRPTQPTRRAVVSRRRISSRNRAGAARSRVANDSTLRGARATCAGCRLPDQGRTSRCA